MPNDSQAFVTEWKGKSLDGAREYNIFDTALLIISPLKLSLSKFETGPLCGSGYLCQTGSIKWLTSHWRVYVALAFHRSKENPLSLGVKR